jgi:CRP-like cAMP-binding protein
MADLKALLKERAFLKGMPEALVSEVAGCARESKFAAGEFLLRAGGTADRTYLILSGKVTLEVDTPGKGPFRFESIGAGEVVGWSWMLSPYRWHFDAIAVEPTETIVLDGACLRTKCEKNHELGYELSKRFLYVLQQRLEGLRMQVMDIYHADSSTR